MRGACCLCHAETRRFAVARAAALPPAASFARGTACTAASTSPGAPSHMFHYAKRRAAWWVAYTSFASVRSRVAVCQCLAACTAVSDASGVSTAVSHRACRARDGRGAPHCPTSSARAFSRGCQLQHRLWLCLQQTSSVAPPAALAPQQIRKFGHISAAQNGAEPIRKPWPLVPKQVSVGAPGALGIQQSVFSPALAEPTGRLATPQRFRAEACSPSTKTHKMLSLKKLLYVHEGMHGTDKVHPHGLQEKCMTPGGNAAFLHIKELQGANWGVPQAWQQLPAARSCEQGMCQLTGQVMQGHLASKHPCLAQPPLELPQQGH